MTTSSKKKFRLGTDRWESVAAFTITLVAGILVMAVGAPDKWLGAVFVTVCTFAGMISFYKRRWSSNRFWVIIAGALFLHFPLVWLVFAVLLRQRSDVPLVLCIPGAFLECFIIYHAMRLLDPNSARRH